jgi:hypothetical protein
MRNLDLECARTGRELAEEPGANEKTLTNALTVLEQQGVYACFLYLRSQEQKRSNMSWKLVEFLKRVWPEAVSDGGGEVMVWVEYLSGDLDRLLFAKDLLRQVLTYARYHIKARGSEAQ